MISRSVAVLGGLLISAAVALVMGALHTASVVLVFIVFAGAALFSLLVLMPCWNARPAVLAQVGDFVPCRERTINPLCT